MNFSIITYISHKKNVDGYYSYGPYIREMNIWLKYPQEVSITAPEILSSPDKGEEKYERKNYIFRAIPLISFLGLEDTLVSLFKIPKIIVALVISMQNSDHIHLRCPGNVSLIGCICQVFFPSKPKTAKYAGNWDPEAKQPWTYRFQKWILSNTFLTRNMQVLVYGEWPGQTKNIIPFFTASFSEEEKAEVPKKTFSEPFTFLFVGNLVEGKRPLEAVKLVEAINATAIKNGYQEISAQPRDFRRRTGKRKAGKLMLEKIN